MRFRVLAIAVLLAVTSLLTVVPSASADDPNACLRDEGRIYLEDDPILSPLDGPLENLLASLRDQGVDLVCTYEGEPCAVFFGRGAVDECVGSEDLPRGLLGISPQDRCGDYQVHVFCTVDPDDSNMGSCYGYVRDQCLYPTP